MMDPMGKRTRQQDIKCLGCEGDHIYKDCPDKGDMMRTMKKIQEVDTMDEMGRIMPRIYVALDNRKEYYQSSMIEVKGNIDNQSISILIDSRHTLGWFI
jgi:hypothetical protein